MNESHRKWAKERDRRWGRKNRKENVSQMDKNKLLFRPRLGSDSVSHGNATADRWMLILANFDCGSVAPSCPCSFTSQRSGLAFSEPEKPVLHFLALKQSFQRTSQRLIAISQTPYDSWFLLSFLWEPELDFGDLWLNFNPAKFPNCLFYRGSKMGQFLSASWLTR